MRTMRLPLSLMLICVSLSAFSADKAKFDDKFRQLDELLPTPTSTRTASGAPGHAYWQQKADYTIRATLDESKRAITGSETITYYNNSPDTLNYLWVPRREMLARKNTSQWTFITTAPPPEEFEAPAAFFTQSNL